ncbi:MAG TPA: fibronectin type III domain-containing protein [Anaeromyxobacteraceae bacterium]|nr:fibronectin type III domain-containing protein [Anaeromyxobacteraceae bacterium]
MAATRLLAIGSILVATIHFTGCGPLFPSPPPPPVPSPPIDVRATPGDALVTITWDRGSGAATQNIYWSTSSGAGRSGTRIAGAANPYVHAGLANETPYYYVVTAVNESGESAPSAEVMAKPSANLPAVPTGVQATPGQDLITLTWDSAPRATSYNVYWSGSAGMAWWGVKIADVSSPFVHTGLSPYRWYSYAVTAVNSTGESGPSSEVSAIPLPLIPPTPTGVLAVPGNAQVTVSWADVPSASLYAVYWSTTAGTGTLGTKVFSDSSPYVHTGLTNGTTYHYVVTAASVDGESPPSAQVSATPSAAP